MDSELKPPQSPQASVSSKQESEDAEKRLEYDYIGKRVHDLGVDDKLTAECKKFTNKRRVKVFDKLEAFEQRRFNAFMEAFPQQPFTKEVEKVSH